MIRWFKQLHVGWKCLILAVPFLAIAIGLDSKNLVTGLEAFCGASFAVLIIAAIITGVIEAHKADLENERD